MKTIFFKNKFKRINIFLKKNKLKQINLVISDVDGVLTDGGLFLNENEGIIRKFNVKDGLGIKLLQEVGIKVAFLSGGSGKSIINRAKNLKVNLCLTEIKNKKSAVKDLQNLLNIKKNNTLFIGDDINDIVVKNDVGLLVCPNDAVDLIKLKSDILLISNGGQGVLREVANLILDAKMILNKYSNGWEQKN